MKDYNSKSSLLMIILILASACTEKEFDKSSEQIDIHNLSNELTLLTDISHLPEYITGSHCSQVSSYDTTGGNDDGFSGRFSFLRENEKGNWVLFDQEGSGVINRIWTPTPNSDTLDFYIDNNNHPSFSLAFIDLFSGKEYPFVSPLCGNQLGGYFCYLPIPFEKSCMIVSRGRNIKFHQIQYRLYRDGKKVKSFSPELNPIEKAAIEKIKMQWQKNEKSILDFYSKEPALTKNDFSLAPGKSLTLFESHKGGRILGMEISPSTIFEGQSKDIDIRITWDKETQAAVNCPLADFYGYAFGKSASQSLLVGSQSNRNYFYFPMPYDKSAKVELVYRKTGESQAIVRFTSKIWSSPVKREVEKEGKFYALRNANYNAKTGSPHVMLDHQGKGHYVATLLQAQGLEPGMTIFFEGDDSTAIDGTFRMHGTGSEDYFNGGWYAMVDRWDEGMSLPLHGAMDYSLPYCRTGGYRLFISDKMSFEKSIFHSIEHGPVGNKFPADYTSVAYFYSDTPPKNNPQPNAGNTQVFIPKRFVFFPQLLDFNVFGNIDIKPTWKYGTGGDSFILSADQGSGLRISLDDLAPGTYRISLDYMCGPEGCEFSLWQRQTQISDWLSAYNQEEIKEMEKYITNISLNEASKNVTIRFRTTGEKNSLILNRLILERESENWSKKVADSFIRQTPDPDSISMIWDRNHFSWQAGYIMFAMEKLWKSTGDSTYYNYIKKYVDQQIDKDGKVFTFKPSNLDHFLPGYALLFMVEESGDEKYMEAARQIHDGFKDYPRNSDGLFWHGTWARNQSWIDGVFMGQIFLARYAKVIGGNKDDFDEVVRQMTLIVDHCGLESGLILHGWDESKKASWADKNTGLAPAVWSEGLGWFAVLIADISDFLPKQHAGYNRIEQIRKNLCEGIKNAQDPVTGMWCQVVDKCGEEGNWNETSGTGMFIYLLKKSINDGIISSEEYMPVVEKAYAGMLNKAVYNNEGYIDLLDCSSVGILDSYEAYVNSPKEVSPYGAFGSFIISTNIMEN